MPNNFVPHNHAGHKADDKRTFVRYDVWDGRTDRCLGIGLTGDEAAALMGVKRRTLHSYMSRIRRGKVHKWYVERYFIDEEGGDTVNE